MTLSSYLKDKMILILGTVSGMAALGGYLLALGNSGEDVVLILGGMAAFLLIGMGGHFRERKKYFDRLEDLLLGLDRRYLIAEVMEPSYRLEDRLYREILRSSNRSVIEKINVLEREQQDYKEYIESWIHEVKNPLTTMNLICENAGARSQCCQEQLRKVLLPLRRVENYVDMALFYARSEAVYKDYQIRELDLAPIITEAVTWNKQYLILNHMGINISFDRAMVYGDEKWILFILNQLIINAVKYKKKTEAGQIVFAVEVIPEALCLSIEDDGVGIREHELRRIFDKGFTGSNGRNREENSTGIGLYLCKKLCVKLGMDIRVESVENQYTRFRLTFPAGTFFTKSLSYKNVR